jgi:hypothetical protein
MLGSFLSTTEMVYGQQTEVQADVRIEVSGPETVNVTQGNPIRLRWKATNVSQHSVPLRDMKNGTWCAIELVQQTKRVSSWEPQEYRRSGVSFPVIQWLKNMESTHSVLLTGSKLTQVPPGDYLLRVQVLPRFAGTSPLITDKKGHNLLSPSVFEFPLVVEPENKEATRATARKLYYAILKESDPERRQLLMDELAKLPAEQVAPTWRSLIMNKDTDRYQWAQTLSTVLKKESVDAIVLAQYTDPVRNPDGSIRGLTQFLVDMELNADEALKSHIKMKRALNANSPFQSPVAYD